MKKTLLILASAAVALGFQSCNNEDASTVYKVPTNFVLNQPALQDMYFGLTQTGRFELVSSQPDYGYSAVTDYSALVSLDESFAAADWEENGCKYEALNPIADSKHQSRTIYNEADLAIAINNLLYGEDAKDIPEDIPVQKVYFRAVAELENVASSRIVSNCVYFAQVKSFAAEPVPDFLWTPGESNGWNHGNSQKLFSVGDGVFNGFAFLEGSFKFTNAPDWNNTNYGLDTEDESDSLIFTSGTLDTDGGAGNIPVPQGGLWWCNVNILKLNYELTYCTLGLIGMNGNWNDDVPMTHSADFLTWTGEFDAADNTEFKIRANGGWDINLGGEIDNLTPGGANIPVAAGHHKITLYLASYPYSLTIE